LIDPLHSTGIAHALSGVLRIADILTTRRSLSETHRLLQTYSVDVVHEVQWIDQLVSTCYQAASTSFDFFIAASCLYFVAAIHCERQMAADGRMRDGFLLARSPALQGIVRQAQARLACASRSTPFAQWMREQLEPWNNVGLLDPSLHNRISRSIAPK
jgi:tetracycline 7-halogenase / FADH2 O2-dependent halogenase